MNWKILFAVLLVVLSCSGAIQMVPEPAGNGNLLIGAVIFNIDGYKDTFLTLQDGIEVAIVGRYFDDGVEKKFGRWVRTDPEGYFVLANVPEGEYAVKGFVVNQIGLGELRIANELIDAARNYYELNVFNAIGLTADIFDTKSEKNIINLNYNIFTLYANELVDFKKLEALRNFKLTTGGEADRPPLPVWFIEMYPESGWTDYVNIYF